jgi:L-fuculose-phosphate aldolase
MVDTFYTRPINNSYTDTVWIQLKTETDVLRNKVFETALKMTQAGLVVAKEGNVSGRLSGEEKIAITPSQLPYEVMTPEDILIVDFDEGVIVGKLEPSIETKMHLAVYKARSDVGGVIHTHSPYATALACVHGKIPPLLDEQTVFLGGEVETTTYALSGTPEIAANAAQALRERDATLLANHGTICCGRNLDEALRNAILVEKLAQICVTAKTMGEITLVPPGVVEVQKQYYQYRRQAENSPRQ